MENTLQCGAGKAVITPPAELLPFMFGLGQTVFGDILDDLYVRTILIANGKQSILLVSYDLDKAPYPEEYMEELGRLIGISAEHILFFSIHTHTAPLTGDRSFEPHHDITKKSLKIQEAVKTYEQWIYEQTIKSAVEAKEKLQPVKVGYGWGKSYINVNRCCCYHMDGQKFSICETGVEGEGQVCRDTFVMRLENMRGKPVAFLMNYAVHCVVMFKNDRGDGKSCISSDLGGNVSQYLERKFPDSVAMWSSGAAGDINPALMTLTIYPDPITGEPVSKVIRDLDTSRIFLDTMAGRHFADILKIIGTISCTKRHASINSVIDWVEVPGSDAVLLEENPSVSAKPYRVRMHLVQIGDIAFIGINGELYTSLGEAIKKASPLKNTVIINHNASMLPDNPGYILDDATVEKCRKADFIKLPCSGFRALPGQLEKKLKEKTKEMFESIL